MRVTAPCLLVSIMALMTAPAMAGTVDSGALEAQVDRLLWHLVNDERYSHLQVAANYERLRAGLLDRACRDATTLCVPMEVLAQLSRTQASSISPEQESAIEQLLLTLHNTSTAVAPSPANLIVTTASE